MLRRCDDFSYSYSENCARLKCCNFISVICYCRHDCKIAGNITPVITRHRLFNKTPDISAYSKNADLFFFHRSYFHYLYNESVFRHRVADARPSWTRTRSRHNRLCNSVLQRRDLPRIVILHNTGIIGTHSDHTTSSNPFLLRLFIVYYLHSFIIISIYCLRPFYIFWKWY